MSGVIRALRYLRFAGIA